MILRELITNDCSDQISHTKLWHNIAYLAATIGFIVKIFQANDSPEIWFIYLGTVGVSATASKFISMKYGVPIAPQDGKQGGGE